MFRVFCDSCGEDITDGARALVVDWLTSHGLSVEDYQKLLDTKLVMGRAAYLEHLGKFGNEQVLAFRAVAAAFMDFLLGFSFCEACWDKEYPKKVRKERSVLRLVKS